MAALKAKKEELRRLMKERRENLKAQKEKIDSPFAKYDSSGNLFCSLCSLEIKNNSLWVPHIAGRTHKENAQKKKKGTLEPPQNKVLSITEKRPAVQPVAVKKQKVNTEDSLVESQPTKNKVSLLEGYSSSSEDESDDNNNEQHPLKDSAKNESNVLPTDFFDAAASNLEASSESSKKDEKPPSASNNVEALPEGFFDDPVLDAKVRNIEYKDPVEEEWEKFQKTIAEETNVSKTIIEEDLEESTLERDIMQIDEQIHQWERVKNLQCLADEVKVKAPSKREDGNLSENTDDELEEDDLLDWRAKGVKKS